MLINRYRAKSLKAAIEKAKTDMGPDAKIIHVRQLSDSRIAGYEENGRSYRSGDQAFGKSLSKRETDQASGKLEQKNDSVEIIAAVDDDQNMESLSKREEDQAFPKLEESSLTGVHSALSEPVSRDSEYIPMRSRNQYAEAYAYLTSQSERRKKENKNHGSLITRKRKERKTSGIFQPIWQFRQMP